MPGPYEVVSNGLCGPGTPGPRPMTAATPLARPAARSRRSFVSTSSIAASGTMSAPPEDHPPPDGEPAAATVPSRIACTRVLHPADDTAAHIRHEEAVAACRRFGSTATPVLIALRLPEGPRAWLPCDAAYHRTDEQVRATSAADHGDDRGSQLDARPRGALRADRGQGRGGARGGRVLRLPLRRASGRARPASRRRHAAWRR